MRHDEQQPRLAWGITGSGHFLRECLAIATQLDGVDLFLSRAAAEVMNMYGHDVSSLRQRIRVYTDNTASAVPVGLFYHGYYHTVVVAPATSNTVAKCVWGVSDTLVTNIFAQAGKCRIPSIVFACDTQPVMITEAPDREVTVYPRRVDLENTEKLSQFEHTHVVTTLPALSNAVEERMRCLSTCYS